MSQPTASTPDRPRPVSDVLGGFLRRLEAGEFSPYLKRLDVPDRYICHKVLIRDRGIRYAGCTFDSFEVEHPGQQGAVDALRKFCRTLPEHLTATNGGGLVLTGKQGTGKDHLLFACLTEAILEHGLNAQWTDGIRMYHRIKSAISTNTTEQEIRSFTTPQILAISDPLPPKAELSDYEMGCLRDIIERRYAGSLSTWITTNVESAQEAAQKLTGPLLGRLMHQALELKFDWPGYRKPLKG